MPVTVSPGRALLLVAAGGAVGGVLRAAVRVPLPAEPGSWNWATLSVNAVGAFALAALLAALSRRPSETVRLLLGTGLIGALTTFSSVVVETVLLADTGRPGVAAAYVAVSVGTLVVAAVLGARVVRR